MVWFYGLKHMVTTMVMQTHGWSPSPFAANPQKAGAVCLIIKLLVSRPSWDTNGVTLNCFDHHYSQPQLIGQPLGRRAKLGGDSICGFGAESWKAGRKN